MIEFERNYTNFFWVQTAKSFLRNLPQNLNLTDFSGCNHAQRTLLPQVEQLPTEHRRGSGQLEVR